MMSGRVGFLESAKCYLLRVIRSSMNFAARLGELPWNHCAFTGHLSNLLAINRHRRARKKRKKRNENEDAICQDRVYTSGKMLGRETWRRRRCPETPHHLIPLSQITNWTRYLLERGTSSTQFTQSMWNSSFLQKETLQNTPSSKKCTKIWHTIRIMLIFLSLLSSLQLCPVLGVALVEEVHADPDGLPGDDVDGGGLDLRVAEHHLGLRVIPVQRCCCRNTDDMFIHHQSCVHVQICQKSQRIGCVITDCSLRCGITQPIIGLFDTSVVIIG